jgi:hypothetical protein
MTTFDQIATKIVKEQELIIGPIAWQEAGKVSGLHFAATHDQVSIDDGNGGQVIDLLVGQYEHLFGRASREVCRDAAAGLLADLTPAQVPASLR